MARYKLLGIEVHGQEVNTEALSLGDQRQENALTVVYQTDDLAEANAIKAAGGFFRDRDNFITVERVIDSTDPQPTSTPMPRKG